MSNQLVLFLFLILLQACGCGKVVDGLNKLTFPELPTRIAAVDTNGAATMLVTNNESYFVFWDMEKDQARKVYHFPTYRLGGAASVSIGNKNLYANLANPAFGDAIVYFDIANGLLQKIDPGFKVGEMMRVGSDLWLGIFDHIAVYNPKTRQFISNFNLPCRLRGFLSNDIIVQNKQYIPLQDCDRNRQMVYDITNNFVIDLLKGEATGGFYMQENFFSIIGREGKKDIMLKVKSFDPLIGENVFESYSEDLISPGPSKIIFDGDFMYWIVAGNIWKVRNAPPYDIVFKIESFAGSVSFLTYGLHQHNLYVGDDNAPLIHKINMETGAVSSFEVKL